MTRITGTVPLMGDVFTEEALAGLVGQSAPITAAPYDHTRPIGRATIVEARQEGDALLLSVDTEPDSREDAILAAFRGHIDPDDEVTPMSIGYTVAEATGLPEGHRSFKDVHVRLIGPSSAPPAMPRRDDAG